MSLIRKKQGVMPLPCHERCGGGLITILRGIELQDLPAIPVKDQELVVCDGVGLRISEIGEVVRLLAHHTNRGLAFAVRDNRALDIDPGCVAKMEIHRVSVAATGTRDLSFIQERCRDGAPLGYLGPDTIRIVKPSKRPGSTGQGRRYRWCRCAGAVGAAGAGWLIQPVARRARTSRPMQVMCKTFILHEEFLMKNKHSGLIRSSPR